MYAAKDAGRNAYRFFTADMNARVQLRLQLETDMRRGLMDDEFFLVYQPQIDMQTGRACGVEALLRWRDPERGVIAPSEFIPIAEESGMIQALGARVLRDACRQVVQWHRSNMPLRLSVNLSVQQLQHDSWLSVVEEALRDSGLAPQHLDLEITESVIITHPEKAVATLVKLKQMGVSITIDDFGTGYSSLSYLARLPIQGVKIDQRFVHGLEQQPQRRGDHPGDHRAVALARTALHRRGRRDAGTVQLPQVARVRGSAGLSDRAAAVRSRVALVVARAGTVAPGQRPPGRSVATSLRADSTALPHRSVGTVDVAHHASVVDGDDLHLACRVREDLARAFVAAECAQRRAIACRETDGMAAPVVEHRCHDLRAPLQRLRDQRDRRRCDPRHVGERDDASAGAGCARQRRTQGSRPCPRPPSDRRRRARRWPRAHRAAAESPGRTTATHVAERRHEVQRRGGADARARGDAVRRGRQRREQLGAAEARSTACREQDADRPARGRRRPNVRIARCRDAHSGAGGTCRP